MMTRYLGLMTLFLTFLTGTQAQERVDLSSYFQSLDYYDANNRKNLLSYETKFIKYMQATIDKDPSELEAIDGKTLLYGTLLMANTNQGVRFKQIDLADLKAGDDFKTVMIEREELILSSLKLAQKLLPHDYRIPTWTIGHELYYEDLVNGVISSQTFDKMYELALKDQFSYTSLVIVAHDFKLSPEQEQKMLTLAQLVSDRKVPCVKNKQGACYDPKIAPQTTQVGRLLTGDIFLREANKYLKGGQRDPQGQRIKPGISARVVYGMIKQGRLSNIKDFDWSNIYYNPRIKAVKKLLWKEEEVDSGLFNSVNFQKSYSCVACHQHK